MLIKFKDIPEEETSTYAQYLRSDKWREIRKKILERDGYKCKFCGSTENLRVHHKSYESIYEEEFALNDLITLCDKCHSELHEFLKGEIGEQTKKAIQNLKIETYYRLQADLIDVIIDNLGIPLLQKDKRHVFLYTYLTTFWYMNFAEISPIYFSFSGQNTYCEMKKRGLIK